MQTAGISANIPAELFKEQQYLHHKTRYHYKRSGFVKAMTTRSCLLRCVVVYMVDICQRYEGIYSLHLQKRNPSINNMEMYNMVEIYGFGETYCLRLHEIRIHLIK